MRPRPLAAALLLVALLMPAGLVDAAAGAAAADYIVVLDDEAVSEPVAATSVGVASADEDEGDEGRSRRVDRGRVNKKVNELETRHRMKATNIYGALGGFSARLSKKQKQALEGEKSVTFVTPDQAISLGDERLADNNIAAVKTTTSTSPKMPAGISRVGATRSSTASINGTDQRVDADVAVLDTGVDGGHPDLNVVGGYNCTSTNRSAWGDKHGHGTHVAGTIGALDNGIGVVGVAPGARIWGIKVLNDKGTGQVSWLVCGIDWVTSQKDPRDASRLRMEVANMSLVFGLPNADDRDCGIPAKDAVHKAICRSVSAGVVYAVAAGNEARNARVYRPAAYEEVITVSAIVDYDGKPGGLARQADYCGFYSADPDDTFAKFSNFGADIDMTAPGKCVLSTYPGKRYAWMSGTSMATPHVAGGAALYRVRYPKAKPQQVRMALQHVGTLNWKTSTDPDGKPDRLLWVASFAPPPDFSMAASAPTGYLSPARSVSIPVTIKRTNGHTAPITMRLLDVPAGVTLSGSVIKGNSGTVTVSVAKGTKAGVYSARLRASDGELGRGKAMKIQVDADPPVGTFASPAAGSHTVQSATSFRVSWRESDVGSGVADRTLQRQRARPAQPGSCSAATWSNNGAARTSHVELNESLTTGYCYRWQLTLRDNAANVSKVTSGSVLVDATAPAAPSVSVSGATSKAVLPTGITLPVTSPNGAGEFWFRGGAGGTLTLKVTGLDAESGIALASISPTGPLTGWGTLPTSASGSPASLTLPFNKGAVTTSFALTSRNGAGLTGPARTVGFSRDATAPTAVSWATPAANGTTGGTSLKLQWSGGSDSGSGLATRHVVQRQMAPADGTSCTGVTFADDGAPRLRSNNATESGLVAGRCYRWLVRTADQVGNLAPAVTSGTFRVTP
jgi:subtilisin